jgi:hypothetical protein
LPKEIQEISATKIREQLKWLNLILMEYFQHQFTYLN